MKQRLIQKVAVSTVLSTVLVGGIQWGVGTNASLSTTVEAATNGVVYYATDKLNVRTKPSTSGTIIFTLRKNEEVRFVADAKNGWFKVEARGKIGYASSKYLQKKGTSQGTASLKVKRINQYPELPMGCEIVSLTEALNYKGYRLDKMRMVKEMPYSKHNDPTEGFAGSPYEEYSDTIYQSIFPQALIKTAKNYRKNSEVFTGASLASIKNEIKKGNPVIVYVTYKFRDPKYKTFHFNHKTMRLVDNMHVVLATGYTNNSITVTDSADKREVYTVSNGTFEAAFKSTGRMALVVR